MRITTFVPATGFQQPSRDEAERLLRVVMKAGRPELRNAEIEADTFHRAFVATGYLYRLAQPSKTRSFGGLLDEANHLLQITFDASPVTGAAFFAAILAHGDVCWREQNDSIGQVLEDGLDPYTGGPTANRWRDILTGTANLLAPVPPDPAYLKMMERGPTKIFKADGDKWREVADNETLWSTR
jgi:hypothetical protein